MSATQKTKMVDKLTLGKKLVALLKKRYAGPPSHQERPVLETLLYAICLEDGSVEQAEAAYSRLLNAFHDLNELRVSSITELAQVFDGLPNADWRAHRVRTVLQYVFEKHFEFAFESLRRKTLELATKQLFKIRDLSPFDRNYTLQSALGTHVIPVDHLMTNAAIWLGLASPGESPEQAAETLKSAARKAEVPVFAHFLRCLAVDVRLVKSFEPGKGARRRPPIRRRWSSGWKRCSRRPTPPRKSGKKPAAGRAAVRAADGRDRPTAGPKPARARDGRGAAPARKKK